jgi:hypothetical protein
MSFAVQNPPDSTSTYTVNVKFFGTKGTELTQLFACDGVATLQVTEAIKPPTAIVWNLNAFY